jgi:iron(III) transport system ATP-binding protein
VPGVCHNGRVETPLGTFDAPHLPDGAPALVCVRPQHLQVHLGKGGHCARVVAAEFLGEFDQLQLAVAGLAAPLVLRAAGGTGFRPDDHVHVNVTQAHALVVPGETP